MLDGGADRQTACLRFDSVTAQVQPGGQADMSIGVFMGPLDKRVLRGDPRIKDLSLTGMVVYNFGGRAASAPSSGSPICCCARCTCCTT